MLTETHSVRSPVALDDEGDSLIQLIRHRAATFGPQPYLEYVNDDRTLTFGALGSAVVRWGARLETAGVPPGATVAIAIANPLDFASVFLAVIASGRWAAPLDPAAPPEGVGGLGPALSRVQADVLVADRPLPGRSDIGFIAVGSATNDRGHEGAVDALAYANGPEVGGGGVVLSSSGTTGTPKLIPLTQRQLLHTARSVAAHHRLSPSDRGFNPLPLFHINAEVVGLLGSLVAGSCLVLDDRFHRTNFWDKMELNKVTWINAVPAIVSRLAESSAPEVIPSGIRFIRSASAPLPAETMTRFEERTGIPVLETYGMTEAASQITANPLTGPRKPGSVGLPVGVELRVVPDRTATLESASGSSGSPRLTAGHVEIRGPSVITAYGGDQHRERIDSDGWLRTGDLGHLDEDGYLYLDGRTDDVINRGGEKFFPREIEEAILVEPEVAAVSVIGQDDPVLGQVPVAFLVLRGVDDVDDRDRARLLVDRIRVGLNATLVRTKRPVALHVVARLPVGATGKVQRRSLREHNVSVIYSLGCR
ncbi:MAG TPA: AMP-binding protein [Acidimicrobiales bacterium]|jgi:acyl-CoA synthetase (AMP-forming)/AMP-acid ligase II|nr:AMP-binding protein [Acidimicrobiales bacterium]